MEANTYSEYADKRNYGPILAVQKVTRCAVCEAGCSGHEEPPSAVGSASQIDVQVPPEATWTRAATAGKIGKNSCRFKTPHTFSQMLLVRGRVLAVRWKQYNRGTLPVQSEVNV